MNEPLFPYHQPIRYTFSYHETHHADVTRFRHLTGIGSGRGTRDALRALCGAFTFDTEVYPTRAFPIPVHDPLFRAFAAELLKAIPHLAFYVDLRNEGPWFKYIVWATLSNIEVIDYGGTEEVTPSMVKPNPEELDAKAREVAAAATGYFQSAGLSDEEIHNRCVSIINYLTTVD